MHPAEAVLKICEVKDLEISSTQVGGQPALERLNMVLNWIRENIPFLQDLMNGGAVPEVLQSQFLL